MQGLTLTVALLASAAVLLAPRRYALPIFFAALAWYPSYLAVSLGTVDFRVSRIVVLALLAKGFLTSTGGPRPSLRWVDICVVVAVAAECLAGAFTTPDLGVLLENRAGAAFDTALPYFAARLLVQRREDYITLLKSLLVIAVPLAAFAAYQCVTGHNPIGFLRRYSFISASLTDRMLPGRMGFWRAEGTFQHSIIFGLFLAMTGPLCAGIWRYTKRTGVLAAGLALMLVGMMSSMSSGPWLASIVACAIICLYPFRRYWKPAVVLFVIWLAAIDIGSNRHWYDVLGEYCTLDARTARYRIRLMQVALGGGMSGHWLAGFGPLADPGWGPMIDGRVHTDAVNEYIVLLIRHGLLGLVPFLGAVGGSLAALRRGYSRAGSPADRWLVWCLFSSLAGILAAIFSVSLMGQVTVVFYVMLGLCCAVGEAQFFRRSPESEVQPVRCGRFDGTALLVPLAGDRR